MRELIKSIKNNKIKRLVKKLLLISFIINILGIATIFIYYNYSSSFNILLLGIFIIQSGIVSGLFSVMCGFFFDNYQEYTY